MCMSEDCSWSSYVIDNDDQVETGGKEASVIVVGVSYCGITLYNSHLGSVY